MALPEQVDGQPVEVWAIERFLRHVADRAIERSIRRAIEGGQDAVAVAASLSIGGGSSPGQPAVAWDRKGLRVYVDGWGSEPTLIIPYSRVVEYVRGEYVEQQALF